MRKCTEFGFWLALTIVTWSCTEVYYPDDIESTDRIPVIQGVIHENEGPYARLSWALRYGDTQTEFISGAEVQVTDDQGNLVTLQETFNGYYTETSGEFKGMVGRTYTIHVRLPNGNEYESSPAYMYGQPRIDSLYANPGIRKINSVSATNTLYTENQQGLYVLADLSYSADSVIFFRFHTKVLNEITYTENPGTLSAQIVYKWNTSILGEVYNVNKTTEYDDWQLLREHSVGFLHFNYDPDPESYSSWRTPDFPSCWVLISKVYTISPEVYEYYHSMDLQLNANDQMFAPVPSQVKSTIQCISDPARDVIGVFEASSVVTVYRAFGWKNDEEYQYKELESFPEDIQDGMIRNYPPDFWVLFN
jgi:hypothetical protein